MNGDILRGKTAAIFDMDGTLIDSVGVWNETDRVLCRELTGAEQDPAALQAARDEALRRFQGAENPYLCYCSLLRERYGTDLTAQAIYDRRYAIAQELLERLDYRPGADAFLWALKRAGLTLALATTTRRRSIETYRKSNINLIKKAPLDEIFDKIYTCEDVARIKPDPEIYRRVLTDLCLPPAQCVVFEDSLAGIQAAKGAGIDTVAVYERHSDPDRAAINALSDWQIDSFAALLADHK